jgi:hypothetical protein
MKKMNNKNPWKLRTKIHRMDQILSEDAGPRPNT